MTIKIIIKKESEQIEPEKDFATYQEAIDWLNDLEVAEIDKKADETRF